MTYKIHTQTNTKSRSRAQATEWSIYRQYRDISPISILLRQHGAMARRLSYRLRYTC